MSNEIIKKETQYLANGMDMTDLDVETDGIQLTFEKIRIPAGGGLAYEVPGEASDNPDMVKEFKAVIVYHHPINSYYKAKFDGSSNPPDCFAKDAKVGISAEDGEVKSCSQCPLSKFGSAEDGKGKACKQKRNVYLLLEGNLIPTIMTLPTGSLGEFSKYVMTLLNKGVKTNRVVTKFTLKKAVNNGGINYSQAVFTKDRNLTQEEIENIEKVGETIKALIQTTDMVNDQE